jgi:hypothetical protein
MTSIGAVSGPPQPPHANAALPPQKDRDGDYDNNRPPPPSQSSNPSVGQNVNIKA